MSPITTTILAAPATPDWPNPPDQRVGLKPLRRPLSATPPVAAAGSVRDVFPGTQESAAAQDRQRALRAVASAHPDTTAALAEICNAADRYHALTTVNTFEADHGATHPRQSRSSPTTSTRCSAFSHHPAEHGVHLRARTQSSTSSQPQEPHRITSGPCSRAAGVAMANQN